MGKNYDSGTISSKGNLENKIVYWGIVSKVYCWLPVD